MALMTVRMWQNPGIYPDYVRQLQAFGSGFQATVIGHSMTGGTFRFSGYDIDFVYCNYLSFERNGVTYWASIDNVTYLNELVFQIEYTVDLFRTWIDACDLGTQYVVRSTAKTYKQDNLLGSSQAWDDVKTVRTSFSEPEYRTMVVQTRAREGEITSPTPVQPSPYQFWFCKYKTSEPLKTPGIANLMNKIRFSAKPQNIVSIYSIPFFNDAGLIEGNMGLSMPSSSVQVPGWKLLNESVPGNNRMRDTISISQLDFDFAEMNRTAFSFQVLIPEAGVITIPPQYLAKRPLRLAMDIDLTSGAVNYSVLAGSDLTPISMRSAPLGQIPIVSDPYDTYVSQNQATLTASLLGDVATIGGGIAVAATGGGALIGGGMALAGTQSLLSKGASIKDATSTYSNPPAFLGSALAEQYPKQVFCIYTSSPCDNESYVVERFGYPVEKIMPLVMPASGYIETQNCCVSGRAPRYALEEISKQFDRGLRVI